MAEESLEYYLKAGEIASQLRHDITNQNIDEKSVLSLCNMIEKRIKDRGGIPAFPCNIGINDIAAHYTSNPGDLKTVPPGSLVKIDFGVSIKGYIVDTALTLTTNPGLMRMITAAEEALSAAIKNFRPGKKLSDVGASIHRTIHSLGFQPIQNLSGHMMERYTLHAGKSVPNIATKDVSQIKRGEVYAIEPFVTVLDGAGRVMEGGDTYIYRFVKEKGIKGEKEKALLREIKKRFRTLPFTIRWLSEASEASFIKSFNRLISQRNIEAYPILREAWGKPVAQSEHTVVVNDTGCQVLTA
ncbi:type II methionyl aminopeptidase [[Eubacterium] cellulosolvens]